MSCTTSGPWTFTLSSPSGPVRRRCSRSCGCAEEHEAVLGQIGHAPRPARLAQVGARGEQAQLAAPEAPGDQRRIDERPGPQGQIEPLGDQIDPPRASAPRRSGSSGSGPGTRPSRLAMRPVLSPPAVNRIGPAISWLISVTAGVGVGEPAERRPRALEVEPPRLGQHQLARAALEQPHPQRRLERAHPPADRRLRQPQLAGRGGEAAALHHPHERASPGSDRGRQSCCCHGNDMLPRPPASCPGEKRARVSGRKEQRHAHHHASTSPPPPACFWAWSSPSSA